MSLRALASTPSGSTRPATIEELATFDVDDCWIWVDLEATDREKIAEAGELLQLDPMALLDASDDLDLAKFDDFDHHLLVVMHGISASDEGEIETYEVDCFFAKHALITVRSGTSRSVDRLWSAIQESGELAAGGPDELVAKLADIMLRRWVSVVAAVDEAVDSIVDRALEAEAGVLREITLLRSELGRLRRMSRHHSAVVAELTKSKSTLITETGRRRYSDVYDVARRVDHDLESVRSDLREALDAYNGAEARRATDVSRVLTIYAAVMLPLTLIVGFFGMNFPNIPGLQARYGWELTVLGMVVLALGSLAIFARNGWIKMPTAKQSTKSVVKAVSDASRAPTQIVSALYTGSQRATRRLGPARPPRRQQPK